MKGVKNYVLFLICTVVKLNSVENLLKKINYNNYNKTLTKLLLKTFTIQLNEYYIVVEVDFIQTKTSVNVSLKYVFSQNTKKTLKFCLCKN